jgi:hypothetical protein
MPRKPTETPEGGTPNPPRDRPAKGIAINLQPAEADLLRKVSEQTKITQAELRAHLEGSGIVSGAIHRALRERYTAWRNDQLGRDIFAGLDREKEGNGG